MAAMIKIRACGIVRTGSFFFETDTEPLQQKDVQPLPTTYVDAIQDKNGFHNVPSQESFCTPENSARLASVMWQRDAVRILRYLRVHS